MEFLFIKGNLNGEMLQVNLKTLIVLKVLFISKPKNVRLRIVFDTLHDSNIFKILLKDFSFNVLDFDSINDIETYCTWPCIVSGSTVIAGLCSVSRRIVKNSDITEVQKLLGFREACLMSCSESSLWTKFCEVDIVNTVENILKEEKFLDSFIPTDLTRFEYHLNQPIRIHNIYKYAREKNQDNSITSNTAVNDLNVSHNFAEGPFITLSDILLHTPIKILEHILGVHLFQKELPLTCAWMNTMIDQSFTHFYYEVDIESNELELVNRDVPKESLYKSDPNRYKPQNRIYTKQADIEAALNLIKRSINIHNTNASYGNDIPFEWDNVPTLVNPEGGSLPAKRSKRKCEQLENLVRAVLKITSNNKSTIVDFCSGSGHLGLLLATLLPYCSIILVENKERSLSRAIERIEKLRLTNVYVLQSNLDYFIAKFDIGISLHACGVATDLVIQNCVQNAAHFICCPCCYGGIHNSCNVSYPRSEVFSKCLTYGDYLNIAHASDQTHDNENIKTEQGFRCMDVIDTDRKLYAESNGYEVILGKLLPVTCTPKNNLLVGICNSKI